MLGIARGRRLAGLVGSIALLSVLAVCTPGASASHPETRDVIAVSNNWDGTVDLVSPSSYNRLERIDVAPDYNERFAEIALSPDRLVFFLAIRQAIGEGNDQLADDAFTSPDGRMLYVSRPSLADVVAINMRTEEIKWRIEMDGYRSDHMALSENGRRLLVSDSTEAQVLEINTEKEKVTGRFESGETPHENNYSENGERIFHASIGKVYTPLDNGEPAFDSTKGERFFQVVDADTLEIRKRRDMGNVLRRAGYPDMSSAVRPMTLSPDERYVYFQVSFFHGFIEYDLERKKVRRVVNLPVARHAQDIPREDYVLDSAHHGIAMNPEGTQLCVAGTMSDYGAIVSRKTGAYRIIDLREDGPNPDPVRPYWSTESEDGEHCYISVSGTDRVSVIDYEKKKEVESFDVGDHPQRIRNGEVRRSFVD